MARDDAGAGPRPGGASPPSGPPGGTQRPPEAPRPRGYNIEPHPPKAPILSPWEMPFGDPRLGPRGNETRAPGRWSGQ